MAGLTGTVILMELQSLIDSLRAKIYFRKTSLVFINFT